MTRHNFFLSTHCFVCLSSLLSRRPLKLPLRTLPALPPSAHLFQGMRVRTMPRPLSLCLLAPSACLVHAGLPLHPPPLVLRRIQDVQDVAPPLAALLFPHLRVHVVALPPLHMRTMSKSQVNARRSHTKTAAGSAGNRRTHAWVVGSIWSATATRDEHVTTGPTRDDGPS